MIWFSRKEKQVHGFVSSWVLFLLILLLLVKMCTCLYREKCLKTSFPPTSNDLSSNTMIQMIENDTEDSNIVACLNNCH